MYDATILRVQDDETTRQDSSSSNTEDQGKRMSKALSPQLNITLHIPVLVGDKRSISLDILLGETDIIPSLLVSLDSEGPEPSDEHQHKDESHTEGSIDESVVSSTLAGADGREAEP